MTLEMVTEQTEKLREEGNIRKEHVLRLLEMTMNAADVPVLMRFDAKRELVFIKFLESDRPNTVVNVALDNSMAMLVDIFRQAGMDFLAEA